MVLLITTKEELIQIVPVARSLDFEAFSPELEDAAAQFLKPEIGEALLISINDNLASTEDPWKVAVKLARRTVANYALAKFIPKLAVNINGAGVTRTESNEEKTAFRYQEENVIQSYLATSERNLELLLAYCESKATQLSWSGPELTYLKENHLPTADAFDQIIDIGKSRRIFRKLKPFLQLVQQTRIVSNLGAALNTKILEPNPTGHYQILGILVRQALAYLAFAEALPSLNIRTGDEGVSIISTAASGDNAIRNSPIPEGALSNLVIKHKTHGEILLKNIHSYLQIHASEIEEYSSNSDVFDPEFKPFSNDPQTGGAKLF